MNFIKVFSDIQLKLSNTVQNHSKNILMLSYQSQVYIVKYTNSNPRAKSAIKKSHIGELALTDFYYCETCTFHQEKIRKKSKISWKVENAFVNTLVQVMGFDEDAQCAWCPIHREGYKRERFDK